MLHEDNILSHTCEIGKKILKNNGKSVKLRGKDSEKATCMTQDHLDKSRIYALLESKPLNPRKTNEFL